MFKITLHLGNIPTLTGCQALDFCRAHGLPDTGAISQPGESITDRLARSYKVDEAFARAHFHPSSRTEEEEVAVQMMGIGELTFMDHDYLAIASSLPLERAMALFIAARVCRLKAELSAVKAELAAARAETDK